MHSAKQEEFCEILEYEKANAAKDYLHSVGFCFLIAYVKRFRGLACQLIKGAREFINRFPSLSSERES